MLKRFEIEKQIRQFFASKNYVEVRTPFLVESPGMEPHIRPIEVKNIHSSRKVFLPTSPEFGMKKLIAQGFERIFQINSCFRDEPLSPEHHPEFTMLEFYETHCSLENLQKRVEEMCVHLAQSLHGKLQFPFRDSLVDFTPPWPRLRVVDLFQEHLKIDLRKMVAPQGISWNDHYFKLWLNEIEPKLPKNRPVFVTHYPVSQSSLCNRVKDETGFEWANRFEFYVGQLELGNAFDELRDPVIQRKNFEHDQQVRRETYGESYPTSPIDEDLLKAIAKMPPTSGIAIGVDRLCMLLLNAPHIDAILPLKSYWG